MRKWKNKKSAFGFEIKFWFKVTQENKQVVKKIRSLSKVNTMASLDNVRRTKKGGGLV
jgi:hypothetical protein